MNSTPTVANPALGEKISYDQLAQMPYDIINDKALVSQDFLFKLIIIGDTGKHFQAITYISGVGKSCLLSRVMSNDFKLEHQVTIGVEFGSFVISMNEKIVKL